jgi:hypothetical protein
MSVERVHIGPRGLGLNGAGGFFGGGHMVRVGDDGVSAGEATQKRGGLLSAGLVY